MSALIGHRAVRDLLTRERQGGRFASAYLFHGPAGVGKRRVAEWFLHGLACAGAEPRPCGTCVPCRMWAGGNHPDFHVLGTNEAVNIAVSDKELKAREEGKVRVEIMVERIHELRAELRRQPLKAAGQLVIIDEAEKLNPFSANALLKTLEEPPLRPVIVLITSRFHRTLATIRSRCRAVRFGILSADELRAGMTALGIDAGPLELALAGGSLGRLAALAASEHGPDRTLLCDCCAGREGASWAEAFGAWKLEKQALPVARANAREALAVALLWQQSLLRRKVGAPLPAGMADYARELTAAADGLTQAALEQQLATTLTWVRRLDRNVNAGAAFEAALLPE